MKRAVLFVASFFIWNLSQSQVVEIEKDLKKQADEAGKSDTTVWKNGGVFNLNFSQVSLTNWAAGGQNAISINTVLSLFSTYKKENMVWDNTLDVNFGSSKFGDAAFFKNDDRIDFFSKYGKRAKGSWYYAALANFRTQMLPGYNAPGDLDYISRFLAPGYVLAALGADYKPNNNFTAFVAPFTGKTTLVMDDSLSTIGAFGVENGQNIRNEFGGYMKIFAKHELFTNTTIQTKLDLFSNYLENPQNIDINWEVLLSMKVNKYISASVSTLLIYDDDVKIGIDENKDGVIEKYGPRVQFKEVLAVGFSYKL